MAGPEPLAFHVMTKPIGPVCNLDCTYCFYLEKKDLYPGNRRWRMPDDLLESYVRQYIEAQDVPEVHFAWQGGEPTLMGLPFFRRVVELQRRYAGGKTIHNALQTNGTLLDDEWCRFLAEHRFLVGLSIDGPRELHDAHRVALRGEPAFPLWGRGKRRVVLKEGEPLEAERLRLREKGELAQPGDEEALRVDGLEGDPARLDGGPGVGAEAQDRVQAAGGVLEELLEASAAGDDGPVGGVIHLLERRRARRRIGRHASRDPPLPRTPCGGRQKPCTTDLR